jgi:hypothetical protein
MLAPRHVRLLVVCFSAACSSPPDCNFSNGQVASYAVDTVTLPMTSSDFAYDQNGDGHTDDRMGNIVGALTMNQYDAQAAVDDALRNGMFRPLVQIITAAGSPAREVIVGDSDPSLSRAGFCVTSPGYGTWESPKPADLAHAEKLTMHLPFLDNAVADTTAVHLRLEDLLGGGFRGELSVALSRNTIATVVDPALARALSRKVSTNSDIESLFDYGGSPDGNEGCAVTNDCNGFGAPVGTPACRNPPYGDRPSQCADQCDDIVDTCEVSTNSLVKNVFAPDVQLFADDGVTWAPSPANNKKDSLSFGFGFTAH